MIKNNPTNVESAFEILLEEIEAEFDFVNNVGEQAFRDSDYDKAKEAIEYAENLKAFRGNLAKLKNEWTEKFVKTAPDDDIESVAAQRRDLGRLNRGLRTPESEYYLPILKALKAMGGSGQVKDVLDRVGEIVKDTLTKYDHYPLSSTPDTLRWRNACQWARYSMIQLGLLKSDSPRGIWEISAKGMELLEGNT